MLRLTFDSATVIACLGVVGLALHLTYAGAFRSAGYARGLPVLGLVPLLVGVGVAAVVCGIVMTPGLKWVWQDWQPAWGPLTLAVSFVGLVARLAASLCRVARPELSAAHMFAAGASALLAASSGLVWAGLTDWLDRAPLLMLLPILYCLAARVYGHRLPGDSLMLVAHGVAATLFLAGAGSTVRGFTGLTEHPDNLRLALFFAAGTAFYVLASAVDRRPWTAYAAAAAGAAWAWQLLAWRGVPAEVYTLAFGLMGTLVLAGYRFAGGVLANRGEEAFQSGTVLLYLGVLGSLFVGLERLTEHEVLWRLVGLYGGLCACCLTATWLVRRTDWRKGYLTAAGVEGLLAFLACMANSDLTGWQKAEAFAVTVGVVALILAHVGWFRETEGESGLVDVGLLGGSVLTGVPFAAAAIAHRWEGGTSTPDEVGFLASCLLLTASGAIFRLKATTLCGVLLSLVYVFALLAFVPWGKMNSVAVALDDGRRRAVRRRAGAEHPAGPAAGPARTHPAARGGVPRAGLALIPAARVCQSSRLAPRDGFVGLRTPTMDALDFLKKRKPDVPPVVAVAGDEDFLKRRVVAHVLDRVVGGDGPSLAVSTFAGDKTDISTVRNEVAAASFFGDRRVVVVENADPFVTKFRADLEKYAAAPSAAGVLVLDCKSFPATTKLAKALGDAGVIACKAPAEHRLPAWCAEWCAAAYGKKLPTAAAQLLVELVGPAMGLLDGEMQKLADAIGQAPVIAEADVDRLVARSRSANVFKILDAVGDGRPGQALGVLADLLDDGDEPLKILGAGLPAPQAGPRGPAAPGRGRAGRRPRPGRRPQVPGRPRGRPPADEAPRLEPPRFPLRLAPRSRFRPQGGQPSAGSRRARAPRRSTGPAAARLTGRPDVYSSKSHTTAAGPWPHAAAVVPLADTLRLVSPPTGNCNRPRSAPVAASKVAAVPASPTTNSRPAVRCEGRVPPAGQRPSPPGPPRIRVEQAHVPLRQHRQRRAVRGERQPVRGPTARARSEPAAGRNGSRRTPGRPRSSGPRRRPATGRRATRPGRRGSPTSASRGRSAAASARRSGRRDRGRPATASRPAPDRRP